MLCMWDKTRRAYRLVDRSLVLPSRRSTEIRGSLMAWPPLVARLNPSLLLVPLMRWFVLGFITVSVFDSGSLVLAGLAPVVREGVQER